ncbi:MAG: AAA family ATPase [Candidatus Sumerlaeia bacterium]
MRSLNGETAGEIGLDIEKLRQNLKTVIRGKAETIDLVILALISGGSVLMEDVPGVGKTTLAKALAKSVELQFQRVQFTPDLLPSDILGGSIYKPSDGAFEFREGPVFCNILLADEINRASPRTQSALLEAMSEGQATIEGSSYALPRPFLVIATENPVEFHGTYPLPEAQLDRFLMHLDIGYPDSETEVDILFSQATSHPLEGISSVMTRETILSIQEQVRLVRVDEKVARYIVDLVEETRRSEFLKIGASPRGSLMLFRAGQARGLMEGRHYVLPDDVQYLAPYVLAHRLVLTSKAKYSGANKESIIREILEKVKAPV